MQPETNTLTQDLRQYEKTVKYAIEHGYYRDVVYYGSACMDIETMLMIEADRFILSVS